jgi:predicted metal-dependent phosphoesterase TrpH
VSGADLHVHSTASDGACAPAEVVRRAAAAGLEAVALTDHDTVAGVPEARDAGAALGVRVIAGCEFSVAAPWGELHLLAYCLPGGDAELDAFLAGQRSQRARRMVEMVRRLNAAGIPIAAGEVERVAAGAAVGRPHVARALVARGAARDLPDAFDRYLGDGRTAYVPKRLPAVAEVTRLVRRLGGVTAAAHLKDRGTAPALTRLRDAGVDGVEVCHPAHDREAQDRLGTLARAHAMVRTGGSDWHGDAEPDAHHRSPLGQITVPLEWLDEIERLHRRRLEENPTWTGTT